jgi:nitric oxide reductase NorD protein
MFVEADPSVIEYLTGFDIQTQDTLLELIARAAATNSGLAWQFGNRLPRANQLMDYATIEMWLNQAIDAFDSKGLHHAISKLDELEAVAQHARDKLTGIAFEEVCVLLEHFVTGLNGRKLAIDFESHCYTDTETLYLPSMVNRFPDKQDNFSLYKCMTVHLWAQTWYGTWQIDHEQVFDAYADRHRALDWFHLLESIRLDARIRQELPGIHREMLRLCELADQQPLSELDIPHRQQLTSKDASVHTSLQLLELCYGNDCPKPLHYLGSLQPERVSRVRSARLAQEKDIFRKALAHLQEEKTGKHAKDLSQQEKESWTVQHVPDPDLPNGFTVRLELDGESMPIPDDIQNVISSIIQDLGDIPDEYLVAAGDGAYKFGNDDDKPDTRNVWHGTYHEEGAFLYREWDYRRQRYKKNWCAVRELDVTPMRNSFVADTLEKYSGLVKSIRRTFEVLRGEDKKLKKQPYGDDIDIDALVEAWADTRAGMEMTENIFTRMHKEDRNIAVIFMVDMSGSTKGWINDAERESLLLLCEALETLGDRYAIYGFSGNTRKRCELYRVKSFDDEYDDDTRARITNITPQDYTRLGTFIRHFTAAFAEVEARTKLLITISDGKPEDYDGYRGDYGIEDTRMALFEAQREGIHPFCITIDREARDYLQHMYGAAHYVVLDDVNQLPLKVADIYRNITS